MPRYCPSAECVELFNAAAVKTREELTPDEFRAIVACYGWLSDDEKQKFNIQRSDLTADEVANYVGLQLIDVYFKESA